MVKNIFTFSQNGLSDWFIQRLSAIVLAVYIIFLVAFCIGSGHLSYQSWHGLFQCQAMKVFTLLAMLSLIAHAWIGVWTILTDYVTVRVIRVVLQLVFLLAFLIYFIWTLMILWG